MKLKDDFIVYNSGKEQMLISVSGAFNGMVNLNSSAGYIVELLKNDIEYQDVVEALFNKYDADRTVIENDVNNVISQLRQIGALSE